MKYIIWSIIILFSLSCSRGGSSNSDNNIKGFYFKNLIVYPTDFATLDEGSGSARIWIGYDYSTEAELVGSMRITCGDVVTEQYVSLTRNLHGSRSSAPFNIDTTTLGTKKVQVQFVSNDNRTSDILTTAFRISPRLDLTSPLTIAVNTGDISLECHGAGFSQDTSIRYNGVLMPTAFVSNGLVATTIPAKNVAALGNIAIQIENTYAQGGMSPALNIVITNFTTRVQNLIAKDIVYDANSNVLYASIPSTIKDIGNSIAVVNTDTNRLLRTVFVGSNPSCLALSGDSQYLYVAINDGTSIKRLRLPSLEEDALLPLGSNFYGLRHCVQMVVAPNNSKTIALTTAQMDGTIVNSNSEILVFDDEIQRPNFKISDWCSSLQWGNGDSRIYAGYTMGTTNGDYFIVDLDAFGIINEKKVTSSLGGFGRLGSIHYDMENDRIYADSGRVLSASTGKLVGYYNSSGCFVMDKYNDIAILIKPNIHDRDGYLINKFSLSQYSTISVATIPWVPTAATNRLFIDPARLLKTNGGCYVLGGNGLPVFILSGPMFRGK